MAEPRYSTMWPIPPPVRDLADDRQDDVLGGRTFRQLAVDIDRHRLGTHLRQGLRGQHVLDFAGADAERQRAKRAMRRGMTIAADDGHARHRQPLFGTDDVHDALSGRAHRVQQDAGRRGVFRQRFDLLGRNRILNRQVNIDRRDIVIGGRDGQIGAPHLAVVHPQALEGLRRRDFMHQVQIDVEEIRATGLGANDVGIPQFVAQRFARRDWKCRFPHSSVSVSSSAKHWWSPPGRSTNRRVSILLNASMYARALASTMSVASPCPV